MYQLYLVLFILHHLGSGSESSAVRLSPANLLATHTLNVFSIPRKVIVVTSRSLSANCARVTRSGVLEGAPVDVGLFARCWEQDWDWVGSRGAEATAREGCAGSPALALLALPRLAFLPLVFVLYMLLLVLLLYGLSASQQCV